MNWREGAANIWIPHGLGHAYRNQGYDNKLAAHGPPQDLQGPRRRPARHALQEMDAADQDELEHDISHDTHPHSYRVQGVALGGALGRLLVVVDERPVFRKRSLVTRAPALEAIKPVPSAADDNFRHRRVRALAVAVVGACA